MGYISLANVCAGTESSATFVNYWQLVMSIVDLPTYLPNLVSQFQRTIKTINVMTQK